MQQFKLPSQVKIMWNPTLDLHDLPNELISFAYIATLWSKHYFTPTVLISSGCYTNAQGLLTVVKSYSQTL